MSAETEPIEGTAVEVGAEVVRMPPPGPAATLAVTPQVEAAELVKRLDVIKQAQETAMVVDVDYGVIPGTNKPTLLKPGAEKLSVLFQLDVQLVNEKVWGPDDHLTVLSHATVYHAPTGTRLGYGEGVCTTREKKYAVRMADRACPQCGKATIKRSKYPPRDDPQAEPGWYCFAKIGGCGANFATHAPEITSQTAGEIPNPDLPDLWNTVVKMGEKRARVDAVLAVTGASALFTQDAEDIGGDPGSEPRPARRDVEHTGGSDVTPPGVPVTDERVNALAAKVGDLLTGGTDPQKVSEAFARAGGHAEVFNRAALASLTEEQADTFERLLGQAA